MDSQKACLACTLWNPVLAKVCSLCGTPFPIDQRIDPTSESEDEQDRLFDIIDAHLEVLHIKEQQHNHYQCIYDQQSFTSKNQFRMHLFRNHQTELKNLQGTSSSNHSPCQIDNKKSFSSSSHDNNLEMNDALFALQLGLQFYEEDCVQTVEPSLLPSQPSSLPKRRAKRTRANKDFLSTGASRLKVCSDSEDENRIPDSEERNKRIEVLKHRMERMLAKVSSSLSPNLVSLPSITAPSCLQGSLRDYQLKGLQWLYGLHSSGMSGILADEMVKH